MKRVVGKFQILQFSVSSILHVCIRSLTDIRKMSTEVGVCYNRSISRDLNHN